MTILVTETSTKSSWLILFWNVCTPIAEGRRTVGTTGLREDTVGSCSLVHTLTGRQQPSHCYVALGNKYGLTKDGEPHFALNIRTELRKTVAHTKPSPSHRRKLPLARAAAAEHLCAWSLKSPQQVLSCKRHISKHIWVAPATAPESRTDGVGKWMPA